MYVYKLVRWPVHVGLVRKSNSVTWPQVHVWLWGWQLRSHATTMNIMTYVEPGVLNRWMKYRMQKNPFDVPIWYARGSHSYYAQYLQLWPGLVTPYIAEMGVVHCVALYTIEKSRRYCAHWSDHPLVWGPNPSLIPRLLVWLGGKD